MRPEAGTRQHQPADDGDGGGDQDADGQRQGRGGGRLFLGGGLKGDDALEILDDGFDGVFDGRDGLVGDAVVAHQFNRLLASGGIGAQGLARLDGLLAEVGVGRLDGGDTGQIVLVALGQGLELFQSGEELGLVSLFQALDIVLVAREQEASQRVLLTGQAKGGDIRGAQRLVSALGALNRALEAQLVGIQRPAHEHDRGQHDGENGHQLVGDFQIAERHSRPPGFSGGATKL